MSPATTQHVNISKVFYNYISTALAYCQHNSGEACTWNEVGLPNMATACRNYALSLENMLNIIAGSGASPRYKKEYLNRAATFVRDCITVATVWQETPSTWTIAMVQQFNSGYSFIIPTLRQYINPLNEPGVVCPF